jgi:hypothetical protein
MSRGLDVRRPDLWSGMSGGEIWKTYVADLDLKVDTCFSPDRPRPFVQVRTPSGQAYVPGEPGNRDV